MDYTSIAKRIRQNTQIMVNTFEKNNLQILSIGMRPYNDNDGDLVVMIEVSSINGTSVKEDLRIAVNLYDANGDIYMTGEDWIYADEFDGYNTYTIDFYNDGHVLEKAVNARIYITRA